MKSARYYMAALSVIAAVSVPVVLATNVPEPPPPPEPPPAEAPPSGVIPDCGVKGSIDKTSITCPTDGSPTVVCNLELNASNFGLDDEDCCTCNAGPGFTECDPSIAPPADPLDPPIPGACPQGLTPNLFAGEPTSIIEGVHNPNHTCIYITILDKRTLLCQPAQPFAQPRCRDVAGRRICF
jgi:hypothetical protein